MDGRGKWDWDHLRCTVYRTRGLKLVRRVDCDMRVLIRSKRDGLRARRRSSKPPRRLHLANVRKLTSKPTDPAGATQNTRRNGTRLSPPMSRLLLGHYQCRKSTPRLS